MDNISKLKEAVINYLSNYKAYDLRDICTKYGLLCNTNLDPMHSKAVYIRSGLNKLFEKDILQLVYRIIEECDNPDFIKEVDGHLDKDIFSITMVTRRKIINWLSERKSLEGNLRIDEMLDLAFNISDIPSYFGYKNARYDIVQHMINNDDISYKEMFENVVKAMYITDKKFIKLLEAIVHPSVRLQSEHEEYIKVLNEFLIYDGYQLINTKYISGEQIYTIEKYTKKGIGENIKNIIFAAIGKKPDIVIEDSLTNDIRIIGDENNCLFYNLPISKSGLSWHNLVVWWNNGNEGYDNNVENNLYKRLIHSLDSQPEKLFMSIYYKNIKRLKNKNLPALIPQVYCHYDPKSAAMRNGTIYVHQRMDFLLLFSDRERVVIEIDGKQHYSVGDISSPELYANMVKDDRNLRLYGYEVFRFGGYEFIKDSIECEIINFITHLYKIYGIN